MNHEIVDTIKFLSNSINQDILDKYDNNIDIDYNMYKSFIESDSNIWRDHITDLPSYFDKLIEAKNSVFKLILNSKKLYRTILNNNIDCNTFIIYNQLNFLHIMHIGCTPKYTQKSVILLNLMDNMETINKYYKYYETKFNRNIIINNCPTFPKKDTLIKISNMSDFKNKLNMYTFNLLDCIPLSKNILLSGGCLYNVIFENYDVNKFVDLDIFILKNKKIKKTILITQILSNLIKKGYKCYCYVKKPVYYIFIDGLPRMIQLVFTNTTHVTDLIQNFDTSHTKLIYDGNDIIASYDMIKGILRDTSYFSRGNSIFRMHKILSKNLYVHVKNNNIQKLLKNDNYSNLTNYNEVIKYENIVDFNEIDYNEILNHETVINDINKSKFTNFSDLQTLAELYKFNIKKIFIFENYINDQKLLEYLEKYHKLDKNLINIKLSNYQYNLSFNITEVDRFKLTCININNKNTEYNFKNKQSFPNYKYKIPITIDVIPNNIKSTNGVIYLELDNDDPNFKSLVKYQKNIIKIFKNDVNYNKGYNLSILKKFIKDNCIIIDYSNKIHSKKSKKSKKIFNDNCLIICNKLKKKVLSNHFIQIKINVNIKLNCYGEYGSGSLHFCPKIKTIYKDYI